MVGLGMGNNVAQWHVMGRVRKMECGGEVYEIGLFSHKKHQDV